MKRPRKCDSSTANYGQAGAKSASATNSNSDDPKGPNPENLVSFGEAARRIGLSKKTLRNWVCTGKLRGSNGLCRIAGRATMVDWPLFAAAFIRRAP